MCPLIIPILYWGRISQYKRQSLLNPELIDLASLAGLNSCVCHPGAGIIGWPACLPSILTVAQTELYPLPIPSVTLECEHECSDHLFPKGLTTHPYLFFLILETSTDPILFSVISFPFTDHSEIPDRKVSGFCPCFWDISNFILAWSCLSLHR